VLSTLTYIIVAYSLSLVAYLAFGKVSVLQLRK
jgi:hypothetical protein